MTTIELYEYSPTGDGLFYSVRKNNEPQFTDFENEKDAKAAAFDEACKATMEGPVRVIYTSSK